MSGYAKEVHVSAAPAAAGMALDVVIEEPGRGPRSLRIDRLPCRIGKARDAEIQVSGWRVGRLHAEVHPVGSGLKLVDLGTLIGTTVNGERIVEHGPLTERDEVVIAGVRLRFTPIATAAGVPGETGDGAHEAGNAAQPGAAADAARHGAQPELDRTVPWRRLVHRRLLEFIDLRRTNLGQYGAEGLRAEVTAAVRQIVGELDAMPATIDRDVLIDDVVDEAVGLGPLEKLMADPAISEIMVNGASDVFVERQGRLQRVPVVFTDDVAIRNVIERIVTPLGRRIDEASPLVDARLADGSRVNAIIPPVALRGPTITIRRFNRKALAPRDLIGLGSANGPMLDFLKLCVQERKSLVVAGGTGSGKTTLLNVLSNLIPEDERLVTIEDAAELRLHHDHLVALEARPNNAEGRGAIAIRDLVRNALRMRPDRIIVGECRGGEALDMLQAMNTGHEGSMTTVHANSPRDTLSRLEVMCLMSGLELPLAAIRDQIASAVDLIVQQARLRDGSRKIVSITEVTGVESGRIQTNELFRYAQTGLQVGRVVGRHVPCGQIPAFFDELRERGVHVDHMLFCGEGDGAGDGGDAGPGAADAGEAAPVDEAGHGAPDRTAAGPAGADRDAAAAIARASSPARSDAGRP